MSSNTLSHTGSVMAWFFLAAVPVSAAFSFQFSSLDPAVIDSPQQEVVVSLSLTDLPSPSYFRAAFQKAFGEPYIGYLKNDTGAWVKIKSLSSDCHDYFYVGDTATSSLQLTIKVGEDQIVEPGQYLVKAHRFTATSCSAGEAKNSQTVSLNFSPPSPTPSSTPKPTSKSPPPLASTPVPTRQPTSVPTSLPFSPPPSPAVLAEATQNSPPLPSPSPVANLAPPPSPTVATRPSWPAVLLIGTGCLMLVASGWLLIRPHGLMDKWPN